MFGQTHDLNGTVHVGSKSPAQHGGILPAHPPRKPLLKRKTAGMRRLRAYTSISRQFPRNACKAEITEWRFSREILLG